MKLIENIVGVLCLIWALYTYIPYVTSDSMEPDKAILVGVLFTATFVAYWFRYLLIGAIYTAIFVLYGLEYFNRGLKCLTKMKKKT